LAVLLWSAIEYFFMCSHAVEMCAKPYAFNIEDKTTPHHGGGAQDLLFNMTHN